MDDVLKLISKTYTKDKYGVQTATETEREVFCDVKSISRMEFFEAGRNGLNPEYEFIIAEAEWLGETILEYRGKRYGIYRTYIEPNTNFIELYAERKGGTNE